MFAREVVYVVRHGDAHEEDGRKLGMTGSPEGRGMAAFLLIPRSIVVDTILSYSSFTREEIRPGTKIKTFKGV